MNLINQTVIMSDTLNFSAEQAINPYYADPSVDHNLAAAEHAAIYDGLTEAGVRVIKVPSPVGSQDGVYTANWALVRGDKAVLARLPNVRKVEEDYAEKILQDLGKTVYRVPNDWRFSGQGDSLPCGNYLFCGQAYRSDPEAQAFAADILGYTSIQLQTVPELDSNGLPVTNSVSGWPDSFFYDIDLALAVIKAPSANENGLIAYCPEAFTDDSNAKIDQLTDIDKIIVSLDEAQHAFATNLVSTGETVVMSAHAPKLTAELRGRGLRVITPEVNELAKGGGYIRCTTLSLN
ncbi:hypothetical protein B7Y94_05820 [Candidatus Saccharibacteria bacterium 32-49-12]|nr:MAG: hypothetical protein B7Y94_05820 [Candidatus Saccharibacteria bacterium 32-49-12]